MDGEDVPALEVHATLARVMAALSATDTADDLEAMLRELNELPASAMSRALFGPVTDTPMAAYGREPQERVS